MIIANGTIEVKEKTAGGINPTNGYPIASTYSWGDPIPCQYLVNTHDNLGVVNGESYTRAAYTILIEQQDINSEQIRLRNSAGAIIGEYSIISLEHLVAVCETKILV